MIMNTRSLARFAATGSLLLGGLALQPGLRAQEPTTIQAPVSTGFGVYTPVAPTPTRPEAGLSEPGVSDGFSNVSTAGGRFAWMNFFSQPERTLLERNEFVVRPEAFGSFGELYNKSSGGQQLGTFVTVDAVVHGLRVTVAEAERRLEREYMAPTLGALLGTLARTVGGQLASERNPTVAASLAQVLAYVETGRALVDPDAAINARVREAVEAELGRINAAAGVGTSSVLPGRRIDYSVFAPQGHYRLNETFGGYYRAKTWLSTVGLSLEDADGDLDADEARRATLLARAIDAASSEDRFAERYHDLYELSAFLGGRTDGDITSEMLAGALRGYFGRVMSGATSAMATDSVMLGLARYAQSQLPQASRSGVLRLMPLSSPRGLVDNLAGGRRLAPSTAISAAVLSDIGAADARAAESLRRAFAARVKEDWVQSLEWTLLYTMQPLVVEPAESSGYPRFARTDAWRAMRTASALGAWADFQHPLSSIAVKPIRVGSDGATSSDLATSGYVEPTPEGWSRVSSLAGFLRDGFSSARYGSAIGRELEARFRDIENTSARLMQIAAAELSGRDLTDAQLELIESMPARIAAYETFSDRSLSDGAPIVAGVSSGASGVKPATGHPLALYVIVPRNDGVGGLMLTRGGVYSYYEVEGDAAAWMRSITSGSGDARPSGSWTSSFLAGGRSFSQDSRRFQVVESPLPMTVAYTPTKEEKKQRLFTVDLDMESNSVSSSQGELWYTVRAPELDGVDIIVSVLNTAGREVYRTTPARIQSGKRYDVIRVEELLPGQYFIRVTDYTDRTLASGRFMVVR
jgi:hypothetical protein